MFKHGKKWGLRTLCAGCVFLLLVCKWAFALDVPQLRGRVNDYASLLSPATRSQLENALATFESTESTQIVVLTIPSLEGEPIEDFSIRVADAWKIGQKGMDNGALLLIAKKDRKLRIEVGYGLEGSLTDLISGRIVQQVIVPQFRTGNFDQGVLDGVVAMMQAVKGEFQAPSKPRRPSGDRGAGHKPIFLLLVFAFLVLQLGRISRLLGTVSGGILLPLFGAASLAGSLLWLFALIPLGLIGGYVLSGIGSKMGASAVGHRGAGRMGYWGGTWGGSRGGFSSGGFGGFGGGGGGFGGGGASGGW